MIPKKIHYCWFGKGPKNDLALKCIESWKKYLPDYEFKEWNEDNFDVNMYIYAKEALEHRKFAFVTDVVRLYALFYEGGIYMDTDVEVLKTYNSFLHHHMFSGFESNGFVPTGMMAAEKGSVWAKELLEAYTTRHFILKDGSFDLRTNTEIITEYMLNKGLLLNNTYQEIPDLCTMYPSEYFCPKDHTTGIIKCTENTVCIHHFAGSWLENKGFGKFRHSIKLKIIKLLGVKHGVMIADIITGRFLKRKK